MKKKGITKVFITDVYAEGTDLEGFEGLREEFDVFLIDHHPLVEGMKDTKNVIKTGLTECSAFVIYDLVKDLIKEDMKDILCATMISEFSFNNPENLKFIQEIYPSVTLENIRESEPSKLANSIGGTLIYLQKDKEGIRKGYELVKNRDFEKIKEYDRVVQKDISEWLEKFENEAESYPEKNLYYFYIEPQFNIGSIISTIISVKHHGKTIVLVSPIKSDPDYLKISAKNQGSAEDMSILLKKGIKDLENSTAGGHKPAAGARIMKKDLSKFKENILS
jgi:hypothetical protein